MTWEDAGIGGNLPANGRTLRQLNYAGLAGAGANGLEGAAVPADSCRGDEVVHLRGH